MKKMTKATLWILTVVLTITLCVPAFASAEAEAAAPVLKAGSGSGSKTKITSVELKHKYKVYTGEARTQTDSTVVKAGSKVLKKGRDYTVSYKDNVNVGKATLTVKGKGKYTGKISKTFYIYPKITTKYVNSGGKRYCEIKASGKKTIWTKKTSARSPAQLESGGGLGYNSKGTYFYYDNGKVIALNILTGKKKWTYKSKNIQGSAHAFCHSSGKLYVVSGLSGGPVVILNKKGKLIKNLEWTGNNKYMWPGKIWVKKGKIYLEATRQDSVKDVTLRIDPDTGKVKEV